MNKKERRTLQLNNHYLSLEKLALLCGVENPNGKKLSVKLLKLEKEIYKPILDYCNGDLESVEFLDELIERHAGKVQALFNNNLKGFFINRDPRGYALKIGDKLLRNEYKDLGLQRDWGGYGLLVPEINGN